MIKNIFCSLFILLVSSVALAKGATYLGVSGGYNQLNFPSTTLDTDLIISDDTTGTNTIPSANRVQTSLTNYFVNAHVGYLFAVSRIIKIGPEVGYSKYGVIKMHNIPSAVASTAMGNIKVHFNSVDIYVAAQFILNHFFIQGKFGTLYMVGIATSDYRLNNGTGTPFFTKGVKNNQQFLFATGAAVGFYFTTHISLAFNYIHIFAKNYHASDLQSTGNYIVFTRFSAPTMNLYGLELNFYI